MNLHASKGTVCLHISCSFSLLNEKHFQKTFVCAGIQQSNYSDCGRQHLWRMLVWSLSNLGSCCRIPPLDLIVLLVESQDCLILVEHKQAFTKCHLKSCCIGKLLRLVFPVTKKYQPFSFNSSFQVPWLEKWYIPSIFLLVIHSQYSVIQS